MLPTYILCCGEKNTTPRERRWKLQKAKIKMETHTKKMFAKGKHTPDKNKQNSLCIYILIIFPLGTFAQLELGGKKRQQISH